jgi:uncharacterized membrane protein
MATLTALKFDTAGGAETALDTVAGLAKQNLIQVHDAAVVTWEEGRKKPRTREINDMKSAGALSGAFWGLLFGILFFVPLIGAAVGAAIGALSGSLVDVGINEGFINKVRDAVTPGTSALFLLTSDAVEDRVLEAMKEHDFEIVATNLSRDDEDRLREVFHHAEG